MSLLGFVVVAALVVFCWAMADGAWEGYKGRRYSPKYQRSVVVASRALLVLGVAMVSMGIRGIVR